MLIHGHPMGNEYSRVISHQKDRQGFWFAVFHEFSLLKVHKFSFKTIKIIVISNSIAIAIAYRSGPINSRNPFQKVTINYSRLTVHRRIFEVFKF
jgi:hypothetical protein